MLSIFFLLLYFKFKYGYWKKNKLVFLIFVSFFYNNKVNCYNLICYFFKIVSINYWVGKKRYFCVFFVKIYCIVKFLYLDKCFVVIYVLMIIVFLWWCYFYKNVDKILLLIFELIVVFFFEFCIVF